MPEIAAKSDKIEAGWPDLRASAHDRRHAPVRRGRVGAPRRGHRRPGQPRLRAARRRVPEELVAERDQHRRPEVLPRTARHRRARALRQADDLPRRRDDRRLGPRRRLLRLGLRRRRLRGRAHPHPPAPEGRLQQPGLVQRRLRGAPAVLRLLHPLASRTRWSRSSTGTPRRARSSAAAPAPGSTSPTSAARSSTSPRAVSPPARSASCAAPTPGPGRSSRAARRGARRRWSCSTSTIRTSRTSSGARPRRRRRPTRCATPASTCRSTATASPRSSTRTPTTRSGSRTSSWQAVEADADWDLIARKDGSTTKTLPARDLLAQIADAAWRCADPGVQYDTMINRWHTCPESGRINASNPCSRVHARRRLGLQPGVDQPDEVPPRRRHLRHGGVRAHGRHRLPRAGDRRQPELVPDGEDRRERPRVPPARPRLRQPRRAADVRRGPVRLRRGPQHRRRDHRADDRSRLPQVGRDRRRGRHLRRVREEPRGPQRRHADAPRRVVQARRRRRQGRARRGRAAQLGRGGRARRRARLPQRPGDGARPDRDDLLPDGLRHDRDRARLLAGQVQGAGRRRADDDRQPHRADGPRDARLLADRDRADRGLHQRQGHDRRRPGAAATRTCRCSTSRSASGRSRTWATSR